MGMVGPILSLRVSGSLGESIPEACLQMYELCHRLNLNAVTASMNSEEWTVFSGGQVMVMPSEPKPPRLTTIEEMRKKCQAQS